MWVLPKPLSVESEQIPLDTFRQSMLWKGKMASEKTWRSRIKNKDPRFLHVNCTTSNPKSLVSVTKTLLLNTHRQVTKFCNVPEDVFIQWVKGVRQEYNSTRNPKPKVKPTKWGTPTAFDGHSVERKDLDRLLRHIQSGGRKKRTSSGNLVEQVESIEVEFVYTKVAEYYSQKRDTPLKDFVVEALEVKGYLGYFEMQTPTKKKTWGTPVAYSSQNIKRKDLDALLHRVDKGPRKRRASTGNLIEQVESPEVEYVHEQVIEYHSQKRNIPLKDFVVEALKVKGYLSYFDLPQDTQLELWSTPRLGGEERLSSWQKRKDKWSSEGVGLGCPLSVQAEIVTKEFRGQLNPRWVEYLMGVPMGWTNAKLTKTYQFHNEKKKTSVSCMNNWSTPTSSQRGTDLMNYLLKNIRYLKAGKSAFAPSLGQIVEAEHYSINVSELFRTIDLSLDQTTIKQIIRKEYMGL